MAYSNPTVFNVLEDPLKDFSTVTKVCICEFSELPCESFLSSRFAESVESTVSTLICSLAPATELQKFVRSWLLFGPDDALRMTLESDIRSIAKVSLKNDNTELHRLSRIP